MKKRDYIPLFSKFLPRKETHEIMTKVLVAMSGGVDSSAAALFLLKAGYAVSGVTFDMFDPEADFMPCGSTAAAADAARAAAAAIGIPHEVQSARVDFAKRVIDPFVASYVCGETPIPCIECNRYIKFPLAIAAADAVGADYIATGHYVKLERDQNRTLLYRAADEKKDQSYMLYTLTQDVLRRCLFPLGDCTKADARAIAAEAGLACASGGESQDICFIPDGDYVKFLTDYGKVILNPGDYITPDGKILGRHRGHMCYTVGQRKGLGIAAGERIFVLAKDSAANTVTLGKEELLFEKRLTARNMNLIPFDTLPENFRCEVKVRYAHKAQPATVNQTGDGTFSVEFDEPQRAITPGQSAVIYNGDLLVGGGVICGR